MGFFMFRVISLYFDILKSIFTKFTVSVLSTCRASILSSITSIKNNLICPVKDSNIKFCRGIFAF